MYAVNPKCAVTNAPQACQMFAGKRNTDPKRSDAPFGVVLFTPCLAEGGGCPNCPLRTTATASLRCDAEEIYGPFMHVWTLFLAYVTTFLTTQHVHHSTLALALMQTHNQKLKKNKVLWFP